MKSPSTHPTAAQPPMGSRRRRQAVVDSAEPMTGQEGTQRTRNTSRQGQIYEIPTTRQDKTRRDEEKITKINKK